MNKNNLKIALDARMINMTGIGTYVKHIIDSGIYDIALGDETDIKKYAHDICVIDYKSKIYSIREQFKFPYRKLKKMKSDILHIPHYNVPIFYRGRMFVTIHDLAQLILSDMLPNKLAYFYAKIMLWIATHKAEIIFTVSENTKKDIIRFFKIKPEKIVVTYNGVDLEEFEEKEKSEYKYLYNRYSIPPNKKVILYVANLKPHKNHINLMEAFKDIDDIENTVLVFVGKTFDNPIVDEFKKKYNMEDKIICTGSVNQRELIDFYNMADLFVFPSLYEGFGIPPLEAMACGTPVACSNVSSLPEVVGDAAYTFDPKNANEIKNAINILLKDEKERMRLIEAGRKRCKVFKWSDCKDIFLQNLKNT